MIEYIIISDSEKSDIRQFAINGLEYTLNDLNTMLSQETDPYKITLLEGLINDKILQIDAIRSIG